MATLRVIRLSSGDRSSSVEPAPIPQSTDAPVDEQRDTKPPIPPQDTYRMAIEEYRFQALFNWSRTQYLLAFNAAVLAAASGLLMPAGVISILVFALGMVAALSSFRVVETQHEYYRAARDRLKRVEFELQIPETLRFDTTKGLGGKRDGRSVNWVIKLLLVAIAVADLAGIMFAVVRATS